MCNFVWFWGPMLADCGFGTDFGCRTTSNCRSRLALATSVAIKARPLLEPSTDTEPETSLDAMAEIAEPTKPQTAYWLWLSANRAGLVKELGSSNIIDVAKLGRQKWRLLCGADRKTFDEKANDLKKEYEQKMNAFVAGGGVKRKRRAEKNTLKGAKDAKNARKEAWAASGAPKKPPSAFWIWQTEKRVTLQAQAGTNKLSAMAKVAGATWKELSQAARKLFEDKAKKAKDEYEKALNEWKQNGGNQNVEADDDDQIAEEAEKATKGAKTPAKDGIARSLMI